MSDYGQLRKSLSSYIGDYPPPTKEEKTAWLNRMDELKNILDGQNSKEFTQIRDRMILCNGGFAMKYVSKYKAILNDDVSIMDLFQEATLGVIEAIDTFNIKIGTSFTTYAYFHIRKRIIDFIKRNKLVRAPRDIARNLKHVNEIRSQLFTELNREPTTLEIIKVLKSDKSISLKEDMVNNIVVLLDLNSAGTEEAFMNEFNEQVASEDTESELFRLMESALESKIKDFPEVIQQMIRLRFGIQCDSPHTIEEINYMLDIDEDSQKVIMLTPAEDKLFFI
jgi:RNA polymerase sigma factor (sigma-70 family)